MSIVTGMRGVLRTVVAVVACLAVAACASAPSGSTGSPSPAGAAATTAPTETPRGPGGWLVQTDGMVMFLSLSGSDDALTGTVAGGIVSYGHVVESYSGTAYGTVAEDGTLSLLFDPAPAFSAAGQITGMASGSTLELTYPDASANLVTLTFARGAAADYNTALQALRDREDQAAAEEAQAQAEAEASAQAAAAIETCTRGVAYHDAIIWAYRPGGDAAKACKDIKRYKISEGEWNLPEQPAGPVEGTVVCTGRLAHALVYVYDIGSQYYGGLICEQLPALPRVGVSADVGPEGYGLQIDLDGVVAGSPADKAGLRDRDVIVAVGDYPVSNRLDFDWALSQHAPGDTVTFYIDRGGEPVDVSVTLGRW